LRNDLGRLRRRLHGKLREYTVRTPMVKSRAGFAVRFGVRMNCIRMLVTDLDGTLIAQGEEAEDFLRFRHCLRILRGGCRTAWVIATGRHRSSIEAVLGGLLVRGLTPDVLVLEDARIYKRMGSGAFRPFFLWNFGVSRRRAAWRRKHRFHMEELLVELTDGFPELENLALDTVDIWVRLPDEDQARQVERFVLDRVGGDGECLVFRWAREVYVGPAVGTKGDAVRRLCRHFKLTSDEVLAIGDGPNDISMLNGDAAGLVGCVGNATDRVRDIVAQGGGYVAEEAGLRGVLEVIGHVTGISLADVPPDTAAPGQGEEQESI